MSARRDPLAVVARVRRFREQDSLLGYHQAAREQREAEDALAVARAQVLAAPRPGTSGAAVFVAQRELALGLSSAVSRREEEVEAARGLAASALSHWQLDRSRLRSIELLQERRRLARAEERRVADAAAQDEAATQLWRRHHGQAS